MIAEDFGVTPAQRINRHTVQRRRFLSDVQAHTLLLSFEVSEPLTRVDTEHGFVRNLKASGANNHHIHVSKRASFSTTIDQRSLQRAVMGAVELGLIENMRVALSLSAKLTLFDVQLADGNVDPASGKLQAFENALLAQRGKQIHARFADLVLANVNLLQEQLEAIPFPRPLRVPVTETVSPQEASELDDQALLEVIVMVS